MNVYDLLQEQETYSLRKRPNPFLGPACIDFVWVPPSTRDMRDATLGPRCMEPQQDNADKLKGSEKAGY